MQVLWLELHILEENGIFVMGTVTHNQKMEHG